MEQYGSIAVHAIPLTPAAIPRRPLTLGARFTRGEVTLGLCADRWSWLSLAVLSGCAIASGRSDLTGERPHDCGEVLYVVDQFDIGELMWVASHTAEKYGIARQDLDRLIFAPANPAELPRLFSQMAARGLVHVVIDDAIAKHLEIGQILDLAKNANVSVDVLSPSILPDDRRRMKGAAQAYSMERRPDSPEYEIERFKGHYAPMPRDWPRLVVDDNGVARFSIQYDEGFAKTGTTIC